ncbi:formin-like protein 14 [Trichosurus vulpecula]|uniref:formin-like protein 14 n=1 Tax=Trichosurus vulpecula TaxID=9337 RepID=UPI00186AFD41|nr:formin-like protein 14 [Trichosurus vulpecula]
MTSPVIVVSIQGTSSRESGEGEGGEQKQYAGLSTGSDGVTRPGATAGSAWAPRESQTSKPELPRPSTPHPPCLLQAQRPAPRPPHPTKGAPGQGGAVRKSLWSWESAAGSPLPDPWRKKRRFSDAWVPSPSRSISDQPPPREATSWDHPHFGLTLRLGQSRPPSTPSQTSSPPPRNGQKLGWRGRRQLWSELLPRPLAQRGAGRPVGFPLPPQFGPLNAAPRRHLPESRSQSAPGTQGPEPPPVLPAPACFPSAGAATSPSAAPPPAPPPSLRWIYEWGEEATCRHRRGCCCCCRCCCSLVLTKNSLGRRSCCLESIDPAPAASAVRTCCCCATAAPAAPVATAATCVTAPSLEGGAPGAGSGAGCESAAPAPRSCGREV